MPKKEQALLQYDKDVNAAEEQLKEAKHKAVLKYGEAVRYYKKDDIVFCRRSSLVGKVYGTRVGYSFSGEPQLYYRCVQLTKKLQPRKDGERISIAQIDVDAVIRAEDQ